MTAVVMYDDVRTLTAARIMADCGRLPNVIVGSPPCQDISCANRKGQGVDGDRSGLFFDAIRIIGDVRPVWACLENSPTARTRGADRIINALEAEGYAVWPIVVGTNDIGAEHRRKRVWFLAANTNRAERTVREGVAVNADAKQPATKRDPARSWDDLATRAGGHLRVFNGVPDRLATACADAYGDAVVPAIPEAIGKVMMHLVPTDGAMLDLFCGAAGGWSLGMHRAGYRTIAACEIDPWRRAVFAANHESMTNA